jgi:predicted site-specific integrase-resolvase
MQYLSTIEVFRRFGVHRHTLLKWEKQGFIRSWQVGLAINCPKRWALEEVERLENSWKEKKLNKNKIK